MRARAPARAHLCVCVRACACERHVDSIKCKSSHTSSLTNDVVEGQLKAYGILIYYEKQEESRKCMLCPGKSYFVNNRYLNKFINSKAYASIIRHGKTDIQRQTCTNKDRQTAMEIDRQTDTQTDRRMGRQAGGQTSRHTDRQTDRDTCRQPWKWTDGETGGQAGGQAGRHTHTHTHTHTHS